jgi:hypothetical protein
MICWYVSCDVILGVSAHITYTVLGGVILYLEMTFIAEFSEISRSYFKQLLRIDCGARLVYLRENFKNLVAQSN